MVLEDLSCKGAGGRRSCVRFFINSRAGLLGGLTDLCEKAKIPVENIEYRYCRVVSLSPVLKNNNVQPATFSSTRLTTIAALTNEVNDIIKEINAYDDGPELNKQYKQGISEIQTKLNKLRFTSKTTTSVAQYLTTHTSLSKRHNFIKWLLTFDSNLLDLKLAHTVVNAPDKEKIFIFAGGSHITRAGALLQKAGYKKV